MHPSPRSVQVPSNALAAIYLHLLCSFRLIDGLPPRPAGPGVRCRTRASLPGARARALAAPFHTASLTPCCDGAQLADPCIERRDVNSSAGPGPSSCRLFPALSSRRRTYCLPRAKGTTICRASLVSGGCGHIAGCMRSSSFYDAAAAAAPGWRPSPLYAATAAAPRGAVSAAAFASGDGCVVPALHGTCIIEKGHGECSSCRLGWLLCS